MLQFKMSEPATVTANENASPEFVDVVFSDEYLAVDDNCGHEEEHE